MKKYILVLILTVLIVPQVTLAAWWNPMSWFSRSETYQKNIDNTKPAIKTDQSNDVSSQTSSIDTQNQDKAPETKPAKESAETTVITKIVKIENPELQAKIDLLLKQNNELTTKNNELNAKITENISQINQCKKDLSKLQDSNNSNESERSTKSREVGIALAQLDEINVKVNAISQNPNNVSNNQLSEVYRFKNIDGKQIFPQAYENSYNSVNDWVRLVRPIINKEKSRLLVLQAQYQSY